MKKVLILSVFFISIISFAQNSPNVVSQGTYLGKTIPLRDFATVEAREYKINELRIVPNNLRANEKLDATGLPLSGVDPIRQNAEGRYSPSYSIEQNFDGISITEGGAVPPDPSGAAGPNHYINAVNTALKIFDKSGNLVVGPTRLGTFLGNGTNSGDPIIMYDHLADRFFVSQFGTATNSLVLGVSETPDPTGAYHVYEFVFDSFPDYPHYSIWPDGYYLTANKSGDVVYVLERDVILNGGEDPQIVGFSPPGLTFNPNTVRSPATANLIGVGFPDIDTPGYVTYLQDDGWSSAIANDHLKVWEIDMDWATIGNSTISNPLEIPLTPFDSVFAPFGTGDLEQPGTGRKIDMIGGVISYAANYRTFENHNSWVITFNVDVDGNDTSGVRWIELRNDDINSWSVYQEGTYAPNDGHSRFMGSSAIDAEGNIGLGFNIGSSTLPVGISYTGRNAGDPLGEMTQAETVIVDGIGVQTTTNRFGDYSHLTMDPDGFTFWHTAEYFTATNFWQSRVAAFKLSAGFSDDLSVIDIVNPEDGILTSTENVEIVIRNLGNDNQTNFPLELWLDGTLIATEMFSGTINAGEIGNYTFTQTLDLSNQGQTYSIEVKTALPSDQYSFNDSNTVDVKHLFNNDVGLVSIDSPETASGLGDETISVSIKNYGADSQSNFSIQYTVDGGAPVVETVTDVINAGETVVYNFTQTADLSGLQVYTIEVTTQLSGDQESNNDTLTAEIENSICAPSMDCSFGDGLQLFSVADINNISGCEGYGDFTDQIANLAAGSTYPLTLTTGYGDQHVSVWIDFNNDNIFTDDELLIDNFIIAPDLTGGTYTETVDLVIPETANIGTFRMRAKTNWDGPVPNDACGTTQYGETEDYTANIQVLSTPDFILESNATLNVLDKGEKQFEVVLNTTYDGPAYISIYNLKGQQLKYKKIVKSTFDSYIVRLDMNQVATGIYIVKVGGNSNNSYLTEKFVVK